MLLVDADLPADDPEALLELGELALDASLLLAEQLAALVRLHRVTVRAVSDGELRMGPIEAIDGTPVVDIKPVLGDER